MKAGGAREREGDGYAQISYRIERNGDPGWIDREAAFMATRYR